MGGEFQNVGWVMTNRRRRRGTSSLTAGTSGTRLVYRIRHLADAATPDGVTRRDTTSGLAIIVGALIREEVKPPARRPDPARGHGGRGVALPALGDEACSRSSRLAVSSGRVTAAHGGRAPWERHRYSRVGP